MINVPRKNVPATDTTEPMVSTTNALKHTVHRFWRMNLDDPVDATDVDAEFKARGADQTRERSASQVVFHLLPGFCGKRTVVNADVQIRSHGLKSGGKGLRIASAVHENKTWRIRTQDMAKG